MGKPTICIGENRGGRAVTAKRLSAFVFATRILQFRVATRQGNLNFFKVRELSGNFANCQGNWETLVNVREF